MTPDLQELDVVAMGDDKKCRSCCPRAAGCPRLPAPDGERHLKSTVPRPVRALFRERADIVKRTCVAEGMLVRLIENVAGF